MVFNLYDVHWIDLSLLIHGVYLTCMFVSEIDVCLHVRRPVWLNLRQKSEMSLCSQNCYYLVRWLSASGTLQWTKVHSFMKSLKFAVKRVREKCRLFKVFRFYVHIFCVSFYNWIYTEVYSINNPINGKGRAFYNELGRQGSINTFIYHFVVRRFYYLERKFNLI